MAKKMTRIEKTELSKKGICWKCKGKILKKGCSLTCENCGFEVKS